jgi:hypothetical protein
VNTPNTFAGDNADEARHEPHAGLVDATELALEQPERGNNTASRLG